MRHFFRHVPLTVACVFYVCAQSLAAPSQITPQDGETRIVADKMVYQSDKQQVTFEENVHVTRPDFELWANTLTVYMKPAPKTEQTDSVPTGLATGDVDRLVAQGAVRMVSDNNEGSGNKATYVVDSGVLTLEGNPKVTDGENSITGETIKYYTKENRSEVLSGAKKRVEAVFTTKPEQGRR